MKYIYTDFAFTFLDYYSVFNRREFIFEFVAPLFGAVVCYFLLQTFLTEQSATSFLNNFLSILTNLFAILVGFTFATIAIFTTTDVKKNETLSTISDREIGGYKISWFRFIYVNLIYSAMAGIVMLIMTLCALVLTFIIKDEIVISVLVMGALHNLLLAIKNTTNLYFIFFNQATR